MATPVIAAENTSTNASGTSHTVNLPTGIAAGNLLVVVFGGSAVATLTWPAGWSQFLNAGNSATLAAAYRVADGTEESSITVTSGATSITSQTRAYRITGAEAIAPQAGSNVTVANNATGDPPALAPTWGSMDTLWIATSFASTQTAVNTYPTSYTNTNVLTNGSTGLATCNRANTTASEDPDAFTWAGNGRKNTNTIGIKPGTPLVPARGTLTGAGVAAALLIATLITPAASTLTAAGVAPTVERSADNTNITPAVGTITTSGAASTLDRAIRPSAGAVNVSTGLLRKIGSFTLRNTDGSQSITDVGFLPKLVIFFSSFNWSWSDAVSDGMNLQLGAAVSPTRRFSNSALYLDNHSIALSAPGLNFFRDDNCINVLGVWNLAGTPFVSNRILADLASMDPGGFTLDVVVDTSNTSGAELPFPTDTEVYYLALGGDIAADVGALQVNGTVGNDIAVTGVGFQPSGILLLGNEQLNRVIEAPFNIGAALSSSQRLHALLYGSDVGTEARTYSQARDTKLYRAINDGAATELELEMVSMDTDGFTYNIVARTGTINVGYVALAGNAIEVDVGRFAGATSTGNQDVTSSISPDALILFGDGKAAHTDLSRELRPSLGITIPGVSNVGLGAHAIDTASPSTNVAIRKDNSKSLISVDGGTATVTARGSITKANLPTGFRVNWSDADGTARVFNFLGVHSSLPPQALFGTIITPSAGALAFTGNAPAENNVSITPSVGQLVLTGQTPLVNAIDTQITPSTGVAFFGLDAGTSPSITVSAGALTIDGVAPSAVISTVITPSAGALAITSEAPTIIANTIITPIASELTLVPQTPDLIENHIRGPPAAELVFNGIAPSMLVDVIVAPSTGALTIEEAAPGIIQGAIITPAAGALALSGIAPAIEQGAVITPSVGTLTLSGVGSTLDFAIIPTAGTLTIDGQSPSVEESTAGNTNRTPSVGSLTISGVAPELLTDFRITPNAGELSLTGLAPVIAAEEVSITPSVGTLTLSGLAPELAQDIRITPTAGALALEGQTPAVIQGAVITPTAGTVAGQGTGSKLDLGVITSGGVLTITGLAPIVQESSAGNTNITAESGTLTLNGNAPALRSDTRIEPSAGELTLNGNAPVLAFGTVLQPGTGALIIEGQAPAIERHAVIQPGCGTLTCTGYQPTVDADGVVLPGEAQSFPRIFLYNDSTPRIYLHHHSTPKVTS